ncbi:hypothetical protein ACSX1A_10070 [Pontibacter sp. MBLB2868]|uniref:hypothetical protein n=1 Tax=Pontibacter sp. MBLB2868 TaxID=3451555 RepID=UPI003F753471
MLKYFLYFILFTSLISCKPSGSNTTSFTKRQLNYDAFGAYWYQGKAELNSYDLTQYRYGEPRNAESVLIFVTEDFSREKQVKLDNPEANQADAQKVLKMNMTKKFVTGIYPYSMMLSVFTPVYDSIPAVKVSASSQEWCGHTFTQLNRQNEGYKAKLLSYFESESDQELMIDAMPEDNLWTLLRLDPNQVPTGEVKLIPGLLDQRFTHEKLEAEEATISISNARDSIAGFAANDLMALTVKYKNYPRILRVFYTAAFPYQIAGWEEVRILDGGKEEVSRAVRKATMMIDYWTKNRNEFRPLRDQLKLNNR